MNLPAPAAWISALGVALSAAPSVMVGAAIEEVIVTARNEAGYMDDYYTTVFNDEFGKIEAHTVQSIRLIWSSGRHWEVQAFVENLADTNYPEALYSIPFVGGVTGMWAPPRTWGVQVSYAPINH